MDRVWLRCGVRSHSRLSSNDYFMTIPRPRADSSEVDCNQYTSVSASDSSCSAKSSMPVIGSCVLTFFSDTYVTYTSVTVMFSLRINTVMS